MIDTEFKVLGLDALHRFMQELPVKTEKNILRGMVRAAGKPVAVEAKATAPELQEETPLRVRGALKRSVRIMSTKTSGGVVKGGVAAGSMKRSYKTLNDAFYALWQEKGWKAHGRAVPGRHFLQQAAKNKTPESIDVAAAYVRGRVEAGDLK